MANLPINHGDTGKLARDKINDSFNNLVTTVQGYRPHIESGVRWIGDTNTGVKAVGDSISMKTEDGYIWYKSESASWTKVIAIADLKGDKGDTGNPGAAATITVGTVTTGAAGSDVVVTNSGTTSAAVLNFTIPQGATGEAGADGAPGADGKDGADGADGAAASITVGTTTTLSPGSSATVTNVGTSSAAVLNFGIPQGTPGTGDVVGPASSTDGHLAVFDGATGKLIKDGGSVPTSFAPDSAGTQGQVLTKGVSGYDWATVSGGDVQVSTDAGNLLSTGVKLWLGDKADFDNLGSLDANTIYAPIEGLTRQPGANTMLYMPFSGDYNDSMGNTVSLLYGSSPTYSTTGQGEQYANISNSKLGTTIDGVDINTWTNSIWVYKTSTTVDVVWYYGGNTTWVSGYGTGMFINNRRLTIFEYGGDVDTGVDITLNAWNNVVFTASNGTTKIYVNGVLAATKSKTYNKRGNIFRMFANPYEDVNNYVGGVDEVIFENRVRTDQDVAHYYNQTKGNYGL